MRNTNAINELKADVRQLNCRGLIVEEEDVLNLEDCFQVGDEVALKDLEEKLKMDESLRKNIVSFTVCYK